MSKDPNYSVKVEQAVEKKYGKETVKNPASSWDEIKEKKFLQERADFYKKTNKVDSSNPKEDVNGIKVTKKLLNRESVPFCPVCSKQTSSVRDDVMLVKFDCCNNCYIKWVEGREERWQTGWRPNE